MSATKGRGESLQMSAKLRAASMLGTASRAIWHPAEASCRICFRLPSTSVVLVLSMDWITTGAPPPMGTPPTRICFVIVFTS